MSKFTNPKKQLGEHKVVKSVRLYQSEIDEVARVWPVFSEFARDAILEKLEKEEWKIKNG
jgi:hypothetical protein